MLRLPLLLLLALALLLPAPVRALDLPQRSTSSSGHFTVYCDDNGLRLEITGFADETRARLYRMLGESDSWKHPIIIHIRPASTSDRSGAASSVHVYETEQGQKYQINVRLGADLRAVALQSQIITALLLELAYREEPIAAGREFEMPPPWLVQGLDERLRQQIAGDDDTQVYQTLMTVNQLPSIRGFLASPPGAPGSTARRLYRAYSVSLIRLLLNQPGGGRSLAAVAKDPAAAGKDPTSTLVRHFPSFEDSEASLEKWWTLSIASMARRQGLAVLDAAETDQRLEQALTVLLPPETEEDEPVRLSLGDYKDFVKHPAAASVLERKAQELRALGGRANPLFRPVIADYVEIVERLRRRKTRGIDQRLKEAAAYRQKLLVRIDEIADYLNWFEASELKTESGAFDSYLQAADAIERQHLQRKDPVSAYLNTVEQELD